LKQLQIKLVRSVIGSTEGQRATVSSLGLRKLQQTVTRPDNEIVRGMVNKVGHLLQVTEIEA